MKKFICIFFVISLFLFSACKKQDLVEKHSQGLNEYHIDMTVNNDYTVKASQTVKFKNIYQDVLEQVVFNLYVKAFSQGALNRAVSSMYIDKAYPNGESYGNITINNLKVDDKASDINYQGSDDEFLVVDLDQKLYPDDSIEIYLEYEIEIPNVNHRFGYGDNVLNMGNFYPIVCVYENGEWVKNSYNPNGDPFYSDVSNYFVNVTIDKKYVIASTGDVISETQMDSQKTYKITALAVRDFAFVSSEKFKIASGQAGDVKVNYYYYDDENYDKNLQVSIDSINTFSKLFGQYPYKSYNVVKTNFMQGGMEYPNLVYISDQVKELKDYQNVIIHETAHQWWYGLVGSNEYDFAWLDEGLTDYSVCLFYQNNTNYNINYLDIIKNTTNSYLDFERIYTKILGKVDATMNRSLDQFDTEPEYVYIAYVKGALFFNNIREIIGYEKFIKSLQHYFDQNSFKNASQFDLLESFKSQSKYDLKAVFDSWIDGKVVIEKIA